MAIKTLTIGFATFALGAAFGSAPAFVQQKIPSYSSQGTVIDVLKPRASTTGLLRVCTSLRYLTQQ